MALVDVEVVDAQGNRCPTALNLIQFDLQGAAEWRGGIAVGTVNDQTRAVTDNGILSKTLPVECGVNRVILRSLTQPGKISLKASSQGLQSATLDLVSMSFQTADGISKTLTDTGLKASLIRGPTPVGDSIIPTRKAVHIVGATAGSNAVQAALAFDDNEKTDWKSDGKRGTGWIEFALEHPAPVSEVTLKLGSFKKKSYPLRVTVDGKEAYSGYTAPTLGYVTLPLKPTQGRNVRIELVGAIQNSDKFDMTEVTGKKLESAKSGEARGVLEIIEAEVYETLKAPAQ
jgi:hypothetical protein